MTPWTAAHQASLSFTIFWGLLKFMFIESVMPSNHLILCHPLLLLTSIFPEVAPHQKPPTVTHLLLGSPTWMVAFTKKGKLLNHQRWGDISEAA